MVTWVIREAYLNQLTDNGRAFFSRFVSEVFGVSLEDNVHLSDDNSVIFHFGYDPIKKYWFGYHDDFPPMNMIEFMSYHAECSFEDAFHLIRQLNFPPAVQSTDWISAIELASHRAAKRYEQDALRSCLAHIPAEALAKIDEEMKQWGQEHQEELERRSKVQYETTPEEVLHFYFRPSNKAQGIFFTSRMIVNFMNDQHPGFWKLTEEETGKLLNSEGYVICKGRHKGARGYFFRYREGWHPGIYMELKEAS